MNYSIRDKYQSYGVKNFYQYHSKDYNNPHENLIKESINYIYNNWDINFDSVLDLAAGNGVITKCLNDLGFHNIDAVDPYMNKEYEKNIKKKCDKISFDDIMKGSLSDRKYSTIICSFALHLVEVSKLPHLLYSLSNISNDLLILSPHKKPIIKEDWFWKLKNEMVLNKVRSRLYERK